MVKTAKILCRFDYERTLFFRKAYVGCLSAYRNYIKSRIYGTSDMFDQISIETTTYCNRTCLYCPNSVFDRGQKKNEKLMKNELFRKIIDDLAKVEYRGAIYPYFYGEPLLDNRLVDFMSYAHKQLPRAELIVSTNGDFLNSEIMDKLYFSGVHSFWITLHGDQISEGEKRVKELMQYIKTNKRKIAILCQIMNESTALSTRIGLVRPKIVRKDDFSCLAPLCIDYKGDVLLCCHDYLGQSGIFGNAEKENIMDIWKKSNFKIVRQKLSKQEYILDVCKKCVSAHNDQT